MPRLVYILASSHSGSTLLAMLLGAHPDACTVGELKASSLGNAERYRCSCGTRLAECAFWSKVTETLKRRGIDFEITRAGTNIHECESRYVRRLLRPLHRGRLLEKARDIALELSPAWRAFLQETQRRNVLLIETLQHIREAKVIIDSSKTALRLKYLLRIPQLDVKVIWLVRDGRGVALTYTDEGRFADASDPRLRNGGSGSAAGRSPKPMAEAAWEWRRSNEAAEQVLATLPKSAWIQLRYEALCTNPQKALGQAFGFLDLDPAKMRINFKSVEHHVLGNGMRLDSTSEISLDERWRTHLTAGDLRVFEKIAGGLNRRYGYCD